MGWFDDAYNYVSGGINNAVGSIADSISNAVNSVGNYVGGIVNSINSIVGGNASSAASQINAVGDAVNYANQYIYSNYRGHEDEIFKYVPDSATSYADTAAMVIDDARRSTMTAAQLEQERLDNALGVKTGGFPTLPPATPPPDDKPVGGGILDVWRDSFWNTVNAIKNLPENLAQSLAEKFLTIGSNEFSEFNTRIFAELKEREPQIVNELEKYGIAVTPKSPLSVVGMIVGMSSVSTMISAPLEGLRQSVNYTTPLNMPQANDLVRMELREVWRPEFRDALNEPPPSPTYISMMRLQGFKKDWAEDYWRAHWELPSVGQGFEMYHRLREDNIHIKQPFLRDDLERLMRRNDILPEYIPQLIDISFNPLTRIDIRRMYQLGTISSREDLIAKHRDTGYSLEDARGLSDFVIRDTLHDIYEPYRDRIEALYREGKINQDELRSYLTELDTNPKDIELRIRLADIIRSVAERQALDKGKTSALSKTVKLDKTTLKNAYFQGIITDNDYKQGLRDLKMTERDIEITFKLADAERIKKGLITQSGTKTTSG